MTLNLKAPKKAMFIYLFAIIYLMKKIVIDEKIRHGKPVIEGTRITVDEVLGALAGGMTYEEIEREYGVTKKDIVAVIKYVASFISGEKLHAIKA